MSRLKKKTIDVRKNSVFGGIKVKHFFVLAGIAIAILFQLSCSPDEQQTQPENPITDDSTGVFNAPRFAGNVVLENMYEDEARKLASKTPLEIITVLEGTSKVILEARFRSVREGPFGSPVYECELTDESAEALGGVAAGMSGSPVGPSGRVMGALAFAYSYTRLVNRRIGSWSHLLIIWRKQSNTQRWVSFWKNKRPPPHPRWRLILCTHPLKHLS